MNTLIYYAFNVFVLALIVLGVGMYKPKWILIWLDNPTRMPVVLIVAVLFMISAVMFGEGNKQLQLEQTEISKQLPSIEEVPDLH